MSTDGRSNEPLPHPVVARITPAQPGAIGAIHLAGTGAGAILAKHFSKELAPEGQIILGDFLDHERNPIDQVLLARLPAKEESYEITCHGGLRIVQRIVDTLEHAGARLTGAEDLLPLAYRLDDPVAAEAYRRLPRAKTALAVRFLLHQAQGVLKDAIDRDPASTLKYWPAVQHLLEGMTIVILGPPNAGKSTLLNALARGDHALVADRPGTTRDYVQAPLDLAGLPVELVDTAGLGPTADPLAAEARQKTLAEVRRADLVFLLLDATDLAAAKTFAADFQNLPRVIVLLNKIDCATQPAALDLPAPWPVLEISALRGLHLDKIPSIVWTTLGLDGFDYRQPTVFTSSLAARADASRPQHICTREKNPPTNVGG